MPKYAQPRRSWERVECVKQAPLTPSMGSEARDPSNMNGGHARQREEVRQRHSMPLQMNSCSSFREEESVHGDSLSGQHWCLRRQTGERNDPKE